MLYYLWIVKKKIDDVRKKCGLLNNSVTVLSAGVLKSLSVLSLYSTHLIFHLCIIYLAPYEESDLPYTHMTAITSAVETKRSAKLAPYESISVTT